MTENSTAVQPCNDPGRATAVDGLVILDGPDGVAVTMTPDAAAKTAESLREAAVNAQRGGSNDMSENDPGNPAN